MIAGHISEVKKVTANETTRQWNFIQSVVKIIPYHHIRRYMEIKNNLGPDPAHTEV